MRILYHCSSTGVLHDKVVERSVATYYLNAAEQLMLPLPDEYVEAKVLTGCRPLVLLSLPWIEQIPNKNVALS